MHFALKWIRRGLLLFFGSTLFFVVLYRYVPVTITPLMVIRVFQQIGRGETIRMRRHWVPLDSMSIYMPVAVMASEDQRFLQHGGIDFDAVAAAVEANKKRTKPLGASTISQQTAKNVFLWPTSSWVRKGFEVYFTYLIEWIWGKHRIMEVYLNVIETGDGLYGAEAVAREHFGTTARQLSRPECALIAATLPAPLRFSSKSPSAYILRRQGRIMREMRHIDVFPTEETLDNAQK